MLNFADASIREVGVHPSGEQTLVVPLTLPVTNKDESSGLHGRLDDFDYFVPCGVLALVAHCSIAKVLVMPRTLGAAVQPSTQFSSLSSCEHPWKTVKAVRSASYVK